MTETLGAALIGAGSAKPASNPRASEKSVRIGPLNKKTALIEGGFRSFRGAEDRDRTGDPLLGKEMLYH